MKKYWVSLVIALKADTIYGLSVITWRIRSVMRILVIYILWVSIISSGGYFSGYSGYLILTYVLLSMLVQTVVFSSRTVDVSSDISSGDISNILLKPLNYFKYYVAQDLGNKAMNLFFSTIEFSVFLYFFKPRFFIQTDLKLLIISILLILLAVFIYYFVNISLGFLAFYIPENVWAPRFLFFTILDFFAGGLFPLDMLPKVIFKFIMFTPFPYLLYFPIAVYLGKYTGTELVYYSLIGVTWLIVIGKLSTVLWKVGLKNYESWGR